MTDPAAALAPFAPVDRGVDEPDPARAPLRAAGPVVRVEAPAGGPVWIVTDEAVARAALVDPRMTKDPAWAPPAWDPHVAALEPAAAAVPSLTTLDGPAHAALRQAHAPLFTARRLRAHYGFMTELAIGMLSAVAGEDPVDLAADFTARYPVAVLLELLGIPADRVDDALGACRAMFTGPEGPGRAMATFADLAAAGLTDGRSGFAAELRDRVPAEITRDQLHYLLFGLIFPGQITTDPALGFVLADVLDDGRADADLDDLVRETLRHHPPAPLTLWRFTVEEVELAGVRLPPNAPVLVDILGTGTDPHRETGPDLTFGAGPHYCLGAQLASLELRAVAEVVRTEFPHARLAVPRAALRQVSHGGIGGSRLAALPVVLGRPAE
jgi:cytochrome P450